MGWREVRDKARSQVHATFGLPATYTPPGATLPEQTLACSVRLNESGPLVGDYDSNGLAEQAVSAPEALFLISEVPAPVVGATLVVTGLRSYRIEYVYPVDGITVKAELSRA